MRKRRRGENEIRNRLAPVFDRFDRLREALVTMTSRAGWHRHIARDQEIYPLDDLFVVDLHAERRQHLTQASRKNQVKAQVNGKE